MPRRKTRPLQVVRPEEVARIQEGALSVLVPEYFRLDFVGASPKTVLDCKRVMERFELFVNNGAITPQVYSEWVAHLNSTLANSSANKIVTITNRFLGYCERMGYCVKSPHKLVRLPKLKSTQPRPPFTREEYEKLKSASAGKLMHWAIVVGWNTGMSLGDACLLRWAHNVDLKNMVITGTRLKTAHHGETYCVPIDPTSDLYEMLLEKSKFVRNDWPNKPEQGVHYVDTELAMLYIRQHSNNSQVLNTQFAKIRDQVGIDKRKTFHNFRATMCSILANSEVSTIKAMKITGHKDPSVFKQYVTIDQTELAATLQIARAKQAELEERRKLRSQQNNALTVT